MGEGERRFGAAGGRAGGDWCLLRTNGRGTVRLAESLTEAGVDAWTPNVTMRIRLRRSHRAKERTVAIMPSYVFARTEHLDRLRQLEQRPGRHQAFTIFRYLEHFPLFADAALEPLREAETQLRLVESRARLRERGNRRGRALRPGRLVTIPGDVPGFAGMAGLVETSDDRHTLVTFGGRIRLKIETFILQDDVTYTAAEAGGSHNIAAQAA